MRWFASYWITMLICLAAAGLYWVIGLEVDPIANRLDWLLPGGAPSWWMTLVLVAGCYAVVRVVVHHVVAYTESAIDASPRAEGGRGRQAAIGNAAYTAFGNPTGWWLGPFAAWLGVVAAFAGVVRWSIIVIEGGRVEGGELFVNLLLALAILYAGTVTSAMLFPDRPQSLRPAPEQEPDPVLAIPEIDRPPARPRRRWFGRG